MVFTDALWVSYMHSCQQVFEVLITIYIGETYVGTSARFFHLSSLFSKVEPLNTNST
jgi:hypothetical protein